MGGGGVVLAGWPALCHQPRPRVGGAESGEARTQCSSPCFWTATNLSCRLGAWGARSTRKPLEAVSLLTARCGHRHPVHVPEHTTLKLGKRRAPVATEGGRGWGEPCRKGVCPPRPVRGAHVIRTPSHGAGDTGPFHSCFPPLCTDGHLPTGAVSARCPQAACGGAGSPRPAGSDAHTGPLSAFCRCPFQGRGGVAFQGPCGAPRFARATSVSTGQKAGGADSLTFEAVQMQILSRLSNWPKVGAPEC